MIRELYLLSFKASPAAVGGGEGSAVTGTAQMKVGRRRRLSLDETLWEGKRGLDGRMVARADTMAACMAARGENDQGFKIWFRDWGSESEGFDR